MENDELKRYLQSRILLDVTEEILEEGHDKDADLVKQGKTARSLE